MYFLIQILIGIIIMVVGALFLVKTYRIVNFIGRNGWAEQNLGDGGTYTLLRLIGAVLIIAGLLLSFGLLNIF